MKDWTQKLQQEKKEAEQSAEIIIVEEKSKAAETESLQQLIKGIQ